MDSTAMQVLTAGGAGSDDRKKTKKRRKKRSQNQTSPAKSGGGKEGAGNVTAGQTSNTNTSNGSLLDFAPGHQLAAPESGKRTKTTILAPIGSNQQEHDGKSSRPSSSLPTDLLSTLELEASESQDPNINDGDEHGDGDGDDHPFLIPLLGSQATSSDVMKRNEPNDETGMEQSGILESEEPVLSKTHDMFWLLFCFLGIMASFVCYGLLLEFTTSGGRKLHELSFLFVTSSLYTVTAAFGRYVRAETPTTIPPARFAVLGITSMGSTFCSVRSLRYVIYPIQVLAKSCKPVPVMIFGALMGKRYPLRKYVNVCLIVFGVALFMGGGDNEKKANQSTEPIQDSSSQIVGVILLFISLCFDGGTGAYEDKLMSVHSVQPFDLMYNIQLGKTILAGVALLVLNQLHIFLQMCQDMGFLLVALGISGAMGQVFIFVTISKFGALTCSIIGLARKVTTLVASIYFYGHHLNGIQFAGLAVAVGSMIMNFMGKTKKAPTSDASPHTKAKPLPELEEEVSRSHQGDDGGGGDAAAAAAGIWNKGDLIGDVEMPESAASAMK
eukprot:CAMPEP_0119546728 /NCGR_PEP_ID=MMETSP1352-20130426/1020_1 /TAXON_ID=265584 /ORGANISM="Stauroneis constricta, Strain CCMP1120" /LENGTH=554 /DNA_ID=CAMNT_0007591453 /DNA_START=73 /DNA_END=1737 /DNA_ORIENTATION=+